MRIGVGVILYFPTLNEIENIADQVEAFEKIYFYDNSPDSNLEMIKPLFNMNKVTYIHTKENDGMCISWNKIFQQAFKDKVTKLLQLDQDSILDDSFYDKIKVYFTRHPQIKICAAHVIFDKSTQEAGELTDTMPINFAITSGTIVDVPFFLAMGGYDENLFIDGVDREFCLRVTLSGEQIYLMKYIYLFQELGTGKKNIFGIYEHNATRNYYISRNRRYVVNKYRDYFKGKKWLIAVPISEVRQLLSIGIFEKDKFEKIKNFFAGKKAYTLDEFGKLGGK